MRYGVTHLFYLHKTGQLVRYVTLAMFYFQILRRTLPVHQKLNTTTE